MSIANGNTVIDGSGDLLMALMLRLKAQPASPLTPLHITGAYNGIGDIPSWLFGDTPEWHCKTDAESLTLFNSKFPHPNEKSWSLYRIPFST